jgi:hypothetical protein
LLFELLLAGNALAHGDAFVCLKPNAPIKAQGPHVPASDLELQGFHTTGSAKRLEVPENLATDSFSTVAGVDVKVRESCLASPELQIKTEGEYGIPDEQVTVSNEPCPAKGLIIN